MTQIQLRCTQKLLRLLGERPSSDTPATDDENDWYANLFWVDGRKCILFTHAESLFCFVVPDIRKADVSPIGPLFARHLEFELAIESLSTMLFGDIDPTAVRVAKTTDRSVVGSMVEFTFLCQDMVDSDGGLERTDFTALNQQLRRTPMGRRKKRFDYPIDIARRRASKPGLS